MKTFRSVQLLALVASALLMTTAGAASKADLEEAMSYDGLEQIKVKGIDLAYARPDASLAAYSKVMLDPVQVAFSKNWDPTRTGSRFKLSTEERENIRSGVAKLVYNEFVKELQTRSSYQVVDAAGPDVLRLKPDEADQKTIGFIKKFLADLGLSEGLRAYGVKESLLDALSLQAFADSCHATNPVPVKAALAMMGMMEEEYRLPLVPMNAKNREVLKATLKAAGVIKK